MSSTGCRSLFTHDQQRRDRALGDRVLLVGDVDPEELSDNVAIHDSDDPVLQAEQEVFRIAFGASGH